MRQKIIWSAFITTAILLCLIFLWPMSFTDAIASDTELWVQITDVTIENSLPNHTVVDFVFQHDSDEYVQIMQILDRYSFRRSLRTFFSDNSITGNNVGFWLHIFSDDKNMTSGGTGEVIVNSRVYRIYGGITTNIEMMNEIRNVLVRR